MARAQGIFEKLVMPGPLVGAHAELEKTCKSCHEPFAQKSQTGLSLACHKPIAADRQTSRNFHSRHPDALQGECKACHTEHKGRAFDIVQLNRETFNHALTNFSLAGSHKRVSCDGCHVKTTKYRETAGRCLDCHKSVDRHKGRLGENCEGCHSEESWRRVRPFDHSKTRFALVASHREVACAKCHAGERYVGLATACVSCHGLQDKHAGRTTVSFDHNKATRFALRGGHAKRCHSGDARRDKLATNCAACHRKDDPQLGTACEQCHKEAGWRQAVAFDHADHLTRFPLIGLHAAVPCEACHRTPSFQDASRACASCQQNVHHAGRPGRNCASCHNPNVWSRWRFDHDRQTRYALTGAHRALQCLACHKLSPAAKVSAPSDCHACHSQDDARDGAFGRACEKCHTTVSFRQGLARQ